MSILGLTIDYGPFAFMEHFNPNHICNHSDKEGRYRYEAQPDICYWNLCRLAEALDPVLPIEETIPDLKQKYDKAYKTHYET